MNYKEPLVSRRQNINQVRYDQEVYREKMNFNKEEMAEKSIVYKDYLEKVMREREERMNVATKYKMQLPPII